MKRWLRISLAILLVALLVASAWRLLRGRQLGSQDPDLGVSVHNEAYYYLNLIAESRFQHRLDQERLQRERDELWYPTLPPKEVR
jgi:hypothetical protein